jgi:hypothetical protein
MTDDLSSPWKKIDREREVNRAAVIQAGAAEFNSRGYRQTVTARWPEGDVTDSAFVIPTMG